MPISHLQPKESAEFREPSFRRGFWKNLFSTLLLVIVVGGLIFLAVLLYMGPPPDELADRAYDYFSELIK